MEHASNVHLIEPRKITEVVKTDERLRRSPGHRRRGLGSLPRIYLDAPPELRSLSPTLRRCLVLIATGKSNKQIARELGVEYSTVCDYCKSIFRKLNVNSKVCASVIAAKCGLV